MNCILQIKQLSIESYILTQHYCPILFQRCHFFDILAHESLFCISSLDTFYETFYVSILKQFFRVFYGQFQSHQLCNIHAIYTCTISCLHTTTRLIRHKSRLTTRQTSTWGLAYIIICVVFANVEGGIINLNVLRFREKFSNDETFSYWGR